MNPKLKSLVNNNINDMIKNAIKGLDYKTSYLIEFGSDTIPEVTEVEIIYTDTGEMVIERK